MVRGGVAMVGCSIVLSVAAPKFVTSAIWLALGMLIAGLVFAKLGASFWLRVCQQARTPPPISPSARMAFILAVVCCVMASSYAAIMVISGLD